MYTKKPLKSAKHVIKYLSRYTHRIAISNARIVKYEDNRVMTLDDTEFFRRYMLHVLPRGFMKIRHYGFLGNSKKEERMAAIRTATDTPDPGPLTIIPEEIISGIIKRDVTICIVCRQKRHHQLE